jgi:hypothetical protein
MQDYYNAIREYSSGLYDALMEEKHVKDSYLRNDSIALELGYTFDNLPEVMSNADNFIIERNYETLHKRISLCPNIQLCSYFKLWKDIEYDNIPSLMANKLYNVIDANIIEDMSREFCIAGGSVLNILSQSSEKIADIDLFLIGDGDEKFCTDTVTKWCNILTDYFENKSVLVDWICTDYAITLQITSNKISFDIQFIKRLFFRGVRHVLVSFDLAPCRFGFYKGKIYATGSAMYALKNKEFFIEPFGVCVPSRIYKYASKNYAPLFPKTDNLVRMYQELWACKKEFAKELVPDSWKNYPAYHLMFKSMRYKRFKGSNSSFIKNELEDDKTNLDKDEKKKKDDYDTEIGSGGVDQKFKNKKVKVTDVNFLSPEDYNKVIENWKKMGYDYGSLNKETLNDLLTCRNFFRNWMIENPMTKMYNEFSKCETFCAIPE